MKNNIKALVYVVAGMIIVGLSAFAIVKMWLSNTFLPVYVGNNYILGMQLLRYFLYAVLFALAIAAMYLLTYGAQFLIKKLRRKLKRRH